MTVFRHRGCPHDQVRDCPLYVIGHDARISRVGCVDDLAKPCRVERKLKGWDYAQACARSERFLGYPVDDVMQPRKLH